MTKRRPLPAARLAAGLAAGLMALLATTSTPAVAGVDVGVSIGFDQPGLYGRIDIGRFPYPQVIAATPVIVVPPAYRYVVRPRPVYMWVPPGHRRDWRRHCGAYGACSVPVVFVRDDWARQYVGRRDGRWADHHQRWDRGWDRDWHDRAHRDRRWDRDDDRRWERDGRGGWERDDRGRGKGHGRRKD